jgi:hypothetical protein
MKKVKWCDFAPETTKAIDEKGVEYEIDINATIEIPENEAEMKRVAPSGAFIVVPPRKNIEA